MGGGYKMKYFFSGVFLLATLLAFIGCGSTGKDFDQTRFDKIVNGTTTASEVEHLFGPPFKKGIQNGKVVWLYEYNYYQSLGPDVTKDLFVVFGENDIVISHQLMTNQP